MSLYQLIFTFLIRIICFVIDSKLDSNQTARLSIIVKRLLKEKRFDEEFFSEKDRTYMRAKKRNRTFVRSYSSVRKQKEEIIEVAEFSPTELEDMKRVNEELEYELDAVGTDMEPTFHNNHYLSTYFSLSPSDFYKFIKDMNEKKYLSYEMCFKLDKQYDECVKIMFLFFMKYGINQTIYAYDGITELFSIVNNQVRLHYSLYKFVLDSGIKLDGFHFSVNSHHYDKIFPSFEEITKYDLNLSDEHRILTWNKVGHYICSCNKEENITCHRCLRVHEILEKEYIANNSHSCSNEDCGRCLQTKNAIGELNALGFTSDIYTKVKFSNDTMLSSAFDAHEDYKNCRNWLRNRSDKYSNYYKRSFPLAGITSSTNDSFGKLDSDIQTYGLNEHMNKVNSSSTSNSFSTSSSSSNSFLLLGKKFNK
jgi:hypothetical protein